MNQDKNSQLPSQPTPSKSSPLKLQKIIFIIILVILVIAAAVLAPRANRKSTNPLQSGKERPESGLQTETELGNFKQEVTVIITSKGVSPQTLMIPNDTRINWMNKDRVAHRIAITPGTAMPPQFDNFHRIDPAGGYPYVIHQIVSFHYYLIDKPTQGGEVIVRN